MATTMPTSNGSFSESTSTTTSAATGFANNASQSEATGPEEVGWYFVEQYYTTLNEHPDRVHLFYNKRSTLVWGNEGDHIVMAQGRTEIGDKIKSLNFNQCKVRVTNVDSLESINKGIVVQVLGQMTNNNEPNRRFSQTFFLAAQPNGYYVLNDIFRYLKEDEEDEDEEEELVPEVETDTVADTSAEPVKEVETLEVPAAEEKEEIVSKDAPAAEADIPEPETAVEMNGTSKTEPEAEPEVEETPVETEKIEPITGVHTGAHIPPLLPAVPALPTPSAKSEETSVPAGPSTSSPAVAQPEPKSTPAVKEEAPATPAAPAKPRTWANLLATNANKAATTAATAATSAATTVANAVTPTPAPKDAPKDTNSTSGRPTTPGTPATPSSAGGWQTTDSSRRQPRPVSISGPPQGQTQAYVKHVNERVDPVALREALAKFGTIKHFEIVKPRSCAFVDFAEPSQFLAAAAANPHRIGDQNVFVEERKPRSGGAPFPGGRGSGAQSGRGDGRSNQGGRGGFQRTNTNERFENGRGGFENGRGANMGGRQGSGRGGSFPRGGGRGGPAVASS